MVSGFDVSSPDFILDNYVNIVRCYCRIYNDFVGVQKET